MRSIYEISHHPLDDTANMSANGSAIPAQTSDVVDKGKGKATEQPTHSMGMDEDEEDEEEESGPEEVSVYPTPVQSLH